jgi:phosphoserine phosphatase
MSPSVVVCDWNGTLIRYRDERPLLENLAVELAGASLPSHPLRTLRIARARRPLQALYAAGRRDDDFDFVTEMFRIYNERVVRGVPVDLIHRCMQRFAQSIPTQQALDHRMLRAVARCNGAGKTTGIVSAGYSGGIRMILEDAGYWQNFHFCEADQLRHSHGKALGFELEVYKRKHEYLLRALKEHRLNPEDTAYIGDSEDDEACFQVVGHPIVAFLARDDVKERWARKYRAFVPEGEDDLMSYLLNS